MKYIQPINQVRTLDEEWIQLIKCAKDIGLKPDDVKKFLGQFEKDKKIAQNKN
ncbi:anti-repressor SinI family protein [Alkalihalobacterium alkalinitrilicum]|uniref:anti-repressor SinI family protein n=1 Tax=Alkalihalobacterium alkalinitrilicum TaxID=427920 RepID=UPI0009951017|nr:anti-repressor SinI family protein [Alkalihalobacterium alkalinitrilicum]